MQYLKHLYFNFYPLKTIVQKTKEQTRVKNKDTDTRRIHPKTV